MDLIKRYGRRGSFGPHGMFFSSRLSNESLIRLHGRYNKEVVKLRGSFYWTLSKKSNPRLVTPWGDAPMRPLEVQLLDKLVQRKFQVPKVDGGREVVPLRYYRRVFTAFFPVSLSTFSKLNCGALKHESSFRVGSDPSASCCCYTSANDAPVARELESLMRQRS